MVSETLFNIVVLALIISVSIHVGNWWGWYSEEEIEERIENKRRKNHFKEMK